MYKNIIVKISYSGYGFPTSNLLESLFKVICNSKFYKQSNTLKEVTQIFKNYIEKFCKIPCETKLAIETSGFSAFMNTISIKLVLFCYQILNALFPSLLS